MRRRNAVVRCVSAAALVMVLLPSTSAGQASNGPRNISLAGEWRFLLDPKDTGLTDRVWQTTLPDRIRLPGSTDQARVGRPNTRPSTYQRPSRIVEYEGAAWYQRDIVIPYAWRRRRITLFLERCHWETRVWLDNRELGMQDSLSVPHVYDLTSAASPGRHQLTIRVDNRMKYGIGAWASAVSEESQTNWNGIIGRMELRGTARVWIEEVQTYPEPDRQSVMVRTRIGNVVGRPVSVTLTHTFRDELQRVLSSVSPGAAQCQPGYTTLEHRILVPPEAGRWDEFSPRVVELGTGLRATDGTTTWLHGSYATFGMRSIGHDATHVKLNGRRVGLRGMVECCVFPLTGFPPTDVETWSRLFGVARSYGLNHMRFHSWCPPEAAFVAADRHGFLLQVEAPFWNQNAGRDAPRDRYIRDEMVRILDTYGNHPSFAMFCVGNELEGDVRALQEIVRTGREHDPRHLYTSSTAFSLSDKDDFSVAAIRGLQGPKTDHDYRDATSAYRRPIIAHEVGQWMVFPNVRDIGRYVGVLRADNLVRIQDGLQRAGLLPYAPTLVNVTGHGSLELYKEEIEVQLRNPAGAGFQLLGLHDFPGHGTATVGLLNAFWESKGLISPAEFRRFCSPTVPLARMKQRAYFADERFGAAIEVAHYGPRDIGSGVVEWRLTTDAGNTLASGEFAPVAIPTGHVTAVGNIGLSLENAPSPCRLTLTVGLRGTDAVNTWRLWVYPRAGATSSDKADVLVFNAVNDAMLEALRAGSRVVLMQGNRAARRSIRGSPVPVFWSPILFPNGPLTMGVWCDPAHAALAGFPTDAWTDWQWWDILSRSRAMVIGEEKPLLEPVVRIVDNFARNLPLALAAQCRVGEGRLLVVAADLEADLSERPAAAQLLRSLMAYAASDAFAPSITLTEEDVLRLFPHASRDTARTRRRPATDEAVLHVRAALATESGRSVEWSQNLDTILKRADGFDYTVAGSAYRDEGGAAWHAPSELRLTLTVPAGFSGTLAVHFHDWNRTGRVAQVQWEGRFVETLADYADEGIWLRLPVSADDTSDGELVLVSRPEGVNDTICEIVLLPVERVP